MKTKLITAVLITMSVFIIFILTVKKGVNLVSPGITSGILQTKTQKSPTPSPTLSPPNAPKIYQFDSQTDLKAELNKVNPQILDSDFE